MAGGRAASPPKTPPVAVRVMAEPVIAEMPLPFRTLRIALKSCDEVRSICWIDSRGEDIYWGPAFDRKETGEVTEDAGKFRLDFAHENPDAAPLPLHVSYHETGQYHVKYGTALNGGPYHLRRPRELTSPFRLGSIITAVGSTYPIASRSVIRKGGRALLIETTAEQHDCRHYLEFVVCPQGTFDMPEPLINLGTEPDAHLIVCVAPLNEHLALLVRHGVFAPSEYVAIPANAEVWAMRTGTDT
jgi:hypothetical protein